MSDFVSRRKLLTAGSLGLAGAGMAALGLKAQEPTAPSGGLGKFGEFLASRGEIELSALAIDRPGQRPQQATEDNILGPYHRKGAPFRGKITPPLEPGEVLVIRGTVWGLDRREPLSGAVLDVWQANAEGRYDNDDPQNPPRDGLFLNRARLVTDGQGFYEYETIKPGRYKIGPDLWRPAHIHYLVRAEGYKPLITQMYFQGDPMNDKDRFIKPSLIIDPRPIKTERGIYSLGQFDIVLEPA